MEDITTMMNRVMANAIQEEMDKKFMATADFTNPIDDMKQAIDNNGVAPPEDDDGRTPTTGEGQLHRRAGDGHRALSQ